MTLLDSRDSEAELPSWLDAQIASPNLRQLVAELASLTDSTAEVAIPERGEMVAWLGGDLEGVLARGTEALDAGKFGELYSDPRLLFGLQSLVFSEGGRYWSNLARGAYEQRYLANRERFDEIAAAAAREVEEELARPAAADNAPPATVPGPIVKAPARPVAKASPVPRALAALAACLAVALGIRFWSAKPTESPWGWNSAAALADAADPAAYLEQLASAAGDWRASRPATKAQLQTRLGELLAGCDRLIAAPHRQLDATDRDWLVDKCRDWRKTISGHLDALARIADDSDVAAVRDAADTTVEKLITALGKRATEIRGRAGSPA